MHIRRPLGVAISAVGLFVAATIATTSIATADSVTTVGETDGSYTGTTTGATPVTYTVTWDSGVTLETVYYYSGSPPTPGQGDGQLTTFVQNLGGVDDNTQIVGKDVLAGGPSSATYTGTLGDVYAVHFDTQELIFVFDGVTNLSLSGFSVQRAGLSNIVAFDTPLPPALLLFGSALVGMGVLGHRRRKNGLAAA